MFGTRKVLGLAFEEGAVRLAELRSGGQRPEVVRVAEFVPPAGISDDEPAALAAALRDFLARHGFTARRAVVGLPASWLMTRECSIPPAGADALRGMLRIQAERAFSSAPGELAMDCVDTLDAGQARPVLIVATLRSRLEQAVAAAQGAGLSVKAVTASSLALAAAVDGPGPGRLLLLRATPAGAELTAQTGAQPRMLRHVGADSMAEQVWRAVALLSQDAWWTSADVLRVVDGRDAAPGTWQAVSERLGVRVQVDETLAALDVDCGPEAADGAAGFAAAVAVARAGLAPGGGPVDFLHSHLTPVRKHGNRKRAAWAAAVGTALLVAGLFFAFDWRAQAAQVAELAAQQAAMAEDVAEAQRLIDTTASARGWYDRRPAFLDCLRELTLAFPERGSVWATSLAVREDMEGVVSGKAADERSVLDVLDRLKAADALAEVKLLYLRQAQGSSGDVAFAMGFTYVHTE